MAVWREGEKHYWRAATDHHAVFEATGRAPAAAVAGFFYHSNTARLDSRRIHGKNELAEETKWNT